jgi:uncharacterized protein YyaL (SSP411 family)
MEASLPNALAQSSSSYLRSAMHQPIRWNEWGREAFARAKAENKPVLLDIGAVWCHWCHVMDRESYESPEVAEIINSSFIPVKVDRDQRPDVDSRYQTAVAAISGQGGWPLTVFLTPEGKPFYGGTYFPPVEMHGRPSFRRILMAISDAFTNRREDVEKEAGNLMHALGNAEGLLGGDAAFTPGIVQHMVQAALAAFDRVNGGFGSAPKFPHPATLDLLLDWYARTGEEQVLTVVTTTLEKMARGGVYDQIAGGFHRYSVDERWCVPHFEKMAYDNSELLKNYAHAYQATSNPLFAHVARGIIGWMSEWLSDRERGGFYASQDADISMHDDGDHFTWTREEARAVLSADEFAAAALHFDIGETGEMHHNPTKNVLWVRSDAEEIAAQLGKSEEDVEALLDSAREKMAAERRKRPIPFIDRTVYTNWNALCVSAFLQASRAIGTAAEGVADSSMEEAHHFALRSLDRALSDAWKPERGLLHVIAYGDESSPRQSIPGMLDDYAFTVLACLDAYEASADLSYFRFALQIADSMIDHFYDEEGGGFFDTQSAPDAIGALAAKRKPFQDSPTPAGDSAAAIALLRLHALTGNHEYRRRAQKTLEVFAGIAEQFGIYAGTYGIAAVWMAKPHTQVVITGRGALAEELYDAACRPFALNKTAVRVTANEATAAYVPPSLADTVRALPSVAEGREVAVVCSNFTCQRPLDDPEALEKKVRELIRETA